MNVPPIWMTSKNYISDPKLFPILCLHFHQSPRSYFFFFGKNSVFLVIWVSSLWVAYLRFFPLCSSLYFMNTYYYLPDVFYCMFLKPPLSTLSLHVEIQISFHKPVDSTYFSIPWHILSFSSEHLLPVSLIWQ